MSSAGSHRSRRAQVRRTDLRVRGMQVAAGTLAGLAVVIAASLPLTSNAPQPATQAAQAAEAAQTAPAAAADSIRISEWWLNAIHGSGAWKWTRGAGVTVAVLDTGVDGHHPDLTGQVIQGPDYTSGGRTLGNRFWGRHGTLMASIIAGHGHGLGKAAGVMGIAPQAKVLSIRVTWENEDPIRKNHAAVVQNNNSIAKGIRYAVDHGAQVINMSLGGGRSLYDGNPVDADAVKYALAKNVVLVASMGNDGAGSNGKNFPAAYPGVIAIGAVDRSFKPWKGSNHRDYVSVAAPGKGIVGADDLGTHYSTGVGTSPSSAMAAGVAALIRSRYPKLTPEQVKQALERGATHKPVTGRNIWIGAGVLDAKGAVIAAHRINKAANGGGAARTPAAAPPKTAPSVVDKPLNLLLIVILSGGGVLVLVGLVLGWFQRHRPGDEPEPVEELADPPPEAEPQEVAQMYAAPVSVAARQDTPQPEAESQPASGNGAARFAPGALQPYELPVSAPHNGNGNGNGHRSNGRVDDFRIEDFRVGLPTDEQPGPPRDDLRIGTGRDVSPELSSDPLSGDLEQLPEPKADTPLADESWRSLLNGRDQAGTGRVDDPGPSEDELPTNVFPAVKPPNAPPQDLSNDPPRSPSKDPLKDPLTDPLKDPLKDPLRDPAKPPLDGARRDPLKDPPVDPRRGSDDLLTGFPNVPLSAPAQDPLSGPLDGPRERRPDGAGGPGNVPPDESFGQQGRPRAPEDHPFGSPAKPRQTDDGEDPRPPWW